MMIAHAASAKTIEMTNKAIAISIATPEINKKQVYPDEVFMKLKK